MAKWLIHSYTPQDPAEDATLMLQLDDHWYRIPPNEPFEVESDFYAMHILAIYGIIYGIVEIATTKTRTGISFDPDSALDDAKAYLVECQERMITQYARQQMEDRVKNNLPTLPPTGFVKDAIKARNVNLQQRYGFTPLGWDRAGEEHSSQIQPTSETLHLRAENDDLKSRLSNLEELMQQLIDAQSKAVKAKLEA